MTSLLIALHVIAAIIFLGPVTVAVSTFQVHAVKAANGNAHAIGAAQALHRVTSTYGFLSAIVPVLGVAVFITDIPTFGAMPRFHVSILLAIIAWALLFFLILPRQRKALISLGVAADDVDATESAANASAAAPGANTADDGVDLTKTKKQLSMFGGIFSALWLIIAVLMFV